MTLETKPRRDEGDIIRSEAEVLELAREVLGRFSACPGARNFHLPVASFTWMNWLTLARPMRGDS